MLYTKLGHSDIKISRIAMGCMTIVDTIFSGNHTEADGIRALHAAFDAGVNFFDTAEAYGDGESESVLGKAFAGRRDQVVIATKMAPSKLSYDQLLSSCEGSLKRLQTDYIDLYQIHWPSRSVPLEETCRALKELKASGKIRAVGVCNFGVSDMHAISEILPVVTNQFSYSLIWRGIEHEVLPLLEEKQIGVLAYSPLMHGLLTGKYATADEVPEGIARTRHFSSNRPKARHGEPGCETETFKFIRTMKELCGKASIPMGQAAIAWVLAQPMVLSVLAGATSEKQILENCRAVDLKLPEDLLNQLTEASEPVKEALGVNADMWAARIA